MIAFGPIPSRRLGQSLGINNIPPKHCTYGCVYCQVGRTDHMLRERRAFFTPETVYEDVSRRLAQVTARGEHIDYLSFVPEGEPTLDLHLGETIERLRPLGYPIAIFSNASLIFREDVRDALAQADWVSLKVDSVDEAVWRQIDRPHGSLSLADILKATLTFAGGFSGTLVTETMLVKGINDWRNSLKRTALFLEKVNPHIAYLATPTRPPAERWVYSPTMEGMYRAYKIFSGHLRHVEMLVVERASDYGISGDAADDLLRTTAVQPMPISAVKELLARDKADWQLVEALKRKGLLVEVLHEGHRFLKRRFPHREADVD